MKISYRGKFLLACFILGAAAWGIFAASSYYFIFTNFR